jgi:hypothetical protein
VKIAVFAVLMVVVLTLVESKPHKRTLGFIQTRPEMDDVDELGQKRGLNYILPRATVHARSVARNAHTLKNVNERMFAETEDAGK